MYKVSIGALLGSTVECLYNEIQFIITVITVAESESEFRITTDTPYLTLMGELWGVYCEDLGKNWPRYNGTALVFFFRKSALLDHDSIMTWCPLYRILFEVLPGLGVLSDTWSLFYQHGLTLIPAWISNRMPSKLWEEITHPFPNFNVFTANVWEWIRNFILHFIMDVIKSPQSCQYTGGHFHLFVTVHMPQTFVHAITSEQLFGFLSFLKPLIRYGDYA